MLNRVRKSIKSFKKYLIIIDVDQNTSQKEQQIIHICEGYKITTTTWKSEFSQRASLWFQNFLSVSVQWRVMSITTTCSVISSRLWPLRLNSSESLIFYGGMVVTFAEIICSSNLLFSTNPTAGEINAVVYATRRII